LNNKVLHIGSVLVQTVFLVRWRVGYLCAAYILRRPEGRLCYHFNFMEGSAVNVTNYSGKSISRAGCNLCCCSTPSDVLIPFWTVTRR